jgi:hypothetical protein
MPKQINSTGEKMPTISSLTDEINRLGESISWWNDAIIVLMVLAALAATGLVIAQRIAFKKADKLGDLTEQRAKLDSNAKDQEIAKLNKEAADASERQASLELEALKLQEKLLSQGPREDLIIGENRRKLVDTLRSFSGQRVDAKPTALIGAWNGISTGVSPISEEMIGLSNVLLGVFKGAGWNGPKIVSNARSVLPGNGVSVHISANASQETKKAAEALVKALRDVPLITEGPSPDSPSEPQNGDAILVVVHPKQQ